MNDAYSTKKVSPLLLAELSLAIKSVTNYGSIEIYVQNGHVTQISTKHIRKTVVVKDGGKHTDNIRL